MWTIYGLKKSSFYIVFSNFSIVVAISLILFVCVKHKKIAGWIPIFILVSLAVVGTVGGFYIWLRVRASHRKFTRPVEAAVV